MMADTTEVKTWLEWGGSKLLAMRLAPAAPSGYRSFWPDYQADATMAYGYTAARLRPAIPNSKEVDLMDQILELPGFVSDITVRRIINTRALVAPVSNRHLYSWAKIAHLIHSSPRRVVVLHRTGLRQISLRLPERKADAIRQSMTGLAS